MVPETGIRGEYTPVPLRYRGFGFPSASYGTFTSPVGPVFPVEYLGFLFDPTSYSSSTLPPDPSNTSGVLRPAPPTHPSSESLTPQRGYCVGGLREGLQRSCGLSGWEEVTLFSYPHGVKSLGLDTFTVDLNFQT